MAAEENESENLSGFEVRVVRWWKPVAGVLTVLILLANGVAAVGQLKELLPGSGPFSPAVDNELLIVIARHSEASDTNSGVHTSIGERLEDEIDRLGLAQVRVEYLGRSIDSENVDAEVGELEEDFGASIVVWGEQTDTAVKTRVRVVEELEVPVKTSFDRCRIGPGACSAADGSALAAQPLLSDFEFVNTGVPNQVSFIALYVVAVTEHLDGDTVEAARLMQAAVDLENLDDKAGLAAAYAALGYYRAFIEEFDKAIADLDRAIELDPDYAAAFYNRGISYDDLGEFDKAIADYDRAIELDPDDAAAFNNRGNTYRKLGEFDKAIADYDRAIELDPDDALAFNNRGISYDDLGEFDKAIADYDRAIELDPDYALAFNNRGISYGKLGEFDKAIADLDRAIELDPDDAAAFNNRGNTYRKLGEFDKAIADYDRAIELDPDDAAAFNNRGISYDDLGEFDKAIADLDRAIELDPDYAAAFNNRGISYGKLGEFDKAIADLDRAIELDPDDAAAFNNRGNTYRKLGEFDKAIADYDRAIELTETGRASYSVSDVAEVRRTRDNLLLQE